MAAFLLRRLLTAIPTLLLIATLAFLLLHLTPGGPFDSGRVLLPQIERAIEARFHLDEPVWRQYLRYLGDLAHGELGPSYVYRNTSVNEIIARGLPVDLAIGSCALLVALLAGFAIGLWAALHPGTWREHVPMTLAVLGISVPTFVAGPLLILVFAMRLHWLPAGDWVAGSWRHLLLPALALALPYTAFIARLVRASALETLASPYIRAARARGLGERAVLLRHALRPTLLPVVSFLGPALAGVLTGSIVIEQVFGLPGIGRYFVTAALDRDYTLVMGLTLLYGVLIVSFNLLVDLCYAWLDPRVRVRA
jgi:oligopeptide transport system permease protein